MVELGRPRSFDKEDALRAAMNVFWSLGFENTSLSALSKAMKLNPPSIYAAFGSKKDLFLQVVDFYTKTESTEIWGELDAAPTAKEAMARMLRASAMAYTETKPQRGCLIVLAAPQSTGPHPEVCEALQARRQGTIRLLTERLERGQCEGELPDSANCSSIANYYITLQQGMSIQARDGAPRQLLLDIANNAMAGWEVVTNSCSVN